MQVEKVLHSEDLNRTIQQIEEEKQIKVILGAVVGSVALGMNHSGSDIDIYYVYLENNYPQKKHDLFSDEETSFRRCVKTNCGVDEVCFWEYTSTMKIPLLQNKREVSEIDLDLLERFVQIWKSPYIWDPYGVFKKTQYYIQEIIGLYSYLNRSYVRLQSISNEDSELSIKKYLKVIYAVSILKAYRTNQIFNEDSINIDNILNHLEGDDQEKILDELHRVKGIIDSKLKTETFDSKKEMVVISEEIRKLIYEEKTKELACDFIFSQDKYDCVIKKIDIEIVESVGV